MDFRFSGSRHIFPRSELSSPILAYDDTIAVGTLVQQTGAGFPLSRMCWNMRFALYKGTRKLYRSVEITPNSVYFKSSNSLIDELGHATVTSLAYPWVPRQ